MRGTLRILRREFGDDIRVTLASFGSGTEIAKQASTETDPAVRHIGLAIPLKFRPGWWLRQADNLLGTTLGYNNRVLNGVLADASAVLQVGGDNYTLDYGYPKVFMEIDRLVLRHRVPLLLWGASVGPFDADPAFRNQMSAHLKSFDSILLREQLSARILQSMGVEANVSMMTDPAFVMEPCKPQDGTVGLDIPNDAIGLNLSPLMAKHVTGGDLQEWKEACTQMVLSIRQAMDRPVILVPHVTSVNPAVDDYRLLKSVHDSLPPQQREGVWCLGDNLNAAEIKWVISRCSLFAGARTHSTIAAISSAVPTLCFAYSTKARGLTEAVYGSLEYCMGPEDLTPNAVAARMVSLNRDASEVRDRLQSALPGMLEGCFAAGRTLRNLVETRQAGAAVGSCTDV